MRLELRVRPEFRVNKEQQVFKDFKVLKEALVEQHFYLNLAILQLFLILDPDT